MLFCESAVLTKIGVKIFQNVLKYSAGGHFENTYFCLYRSIMWTSSKKVVNHEKTKIGIYSSFTVKSKTKIGVNFSKIGIKIGIFDKTVRVCKHKNRCIKNFFLLYLTHPVSILGYTYFCLYTAICK